MSTNLQWEKLRDFLKIGTHVKGVVRSHQPFGIFVHVRDIPFEGLVQITDFKDVGIMTVGEYPRIGTEIEACVLGFKDEGHQIWLGMKPSQIKSMDQAFFVGAKCD